jgi:hypothetical protein
LSSPASARKLVSGINWHKGVNSYDIYIILATWIWIWLTTIMHACPKIERRSYGHDRSGRIGVGATRSGLILLNTSLPRIRLAGLCRCASDVVVYSADPSIVPIHCLGLFMVIQVKVQSTRAPRFNTPI